MMYHIRLTDFGNNTSDIEAIDLYNLGFQKAYILLKHPVEGKLNHPVEGKLNLFRSHGNRKREADLVISINFIYYSLLQRLSNHVQGVSIKCTPSECLNLKGQYNVASMSLCIVSKICKLYMIHHVMISVTWE